MVLKRCYVTKFILGARHNVFPSIVRVHGHLTHIWQILVTPVASIIVFFLASISGWSVNFLVSWSLNTHYLLSVYLFGVLAHLGRVKLAFEARCAVALHLVHELVNCQFLHLVLLSELCCLKKVHLKLLLVGQEFKIVLKVSAVTQHIHLSCLVDFLALVHLPRHMWLLMMLISTQLAGGSFAARNWQVLTLLYNIVIDVLDTEVLAPICGVIILFRLLILRLKVIIHILLWLGEVALVWAKDAVLIILTWIH